MFRNYSPTLRSGFFIAVSTKISTTPCFIGRCCDILITGLKLIKIMMNALKQSYKLFILSVVLAGVLVIGIAEASHSWGKYHWDKSSY